LRKIIFISVVLSVFLSGCSVSRKSGSTARETVKEVYDDNSVGSVIRNNISKENFYIQKADIKVTQDNISARFIAGIKFRKPDTLLISVRSRTGIEAGRAFITKDTILLNDRINKKLLIGNPEIIEAKYGIDPIFIFAVLGDIIVDEKELKEPLDCKKGIFRKEFEINNRRVEYTIDCSKKKVVTAYFEGDIKTGNITIDYGNIMISDRIRYPQRIEITDDLRSLNIILEIKKIESPWDGKIEFVRGTGYKVVKIR
jgi:hypothetical protein